MTEKLTAREVAVVYAARNKHKGDVMERRVTIYTDDHEFEARDQCIHCLLTRAQHRTATSVARFRISTHENGYYCVSIPNYEGGEVVVATEYDREHTTLVEQRDLLVAALRQVRAAYNQGPNAEKVRIAMDAAIDYVDNALATVEQGHEELAGGGSGDLRSD